jgi:hypothetical protein
MRGRDRGCGVVVRFIQVFSTCACSERGKVDSTVAHAPGTVAEELVELWLARPHIIAKFGVLGTSNQRQPPETVPE